MYAGYEGYYENVVTFLEDKNKFLSYWYQYKKKKRLLICLDAISKLPGGYFNIN